MILRSFLARRLFYRTKYGGPKTTMHDQYCDYCICRYRIVIYLFDGEANVPIAQSCYRHATLAYLDHATTHGDEIWAERRPA